MNTWANQAHTMIDPKATPATREIQARAADIAAMFKSGNSVPVNPATVMKNNPTRLFETVEALEKAIRKYRGL